MSAVLDAAKLSPIGVGTWQWGAKEWGWGKGYGEKEAVAALERALELGVNWVDTAEIYGFGRSEELIGRALRGRREKVFIASKVAPYHNIERACERSLRRLGMDVIDLYQIHWPSPRYSIRTMMRAMERLVKAGKIRYIGVSNFSAAQTSRAQQELAKERLASNQVKYNILEREPEEELLPLCRKEGVTLIAYSPLAQGVLSGKYAPDRLPRDLVRRVNPLFSKHNLEESLKLVAVLKEVGAAHGRTPSQVALNWLVRRRGVVAIPGAKSAAQVEENAGGMGWEMGGAEAERIEKSCRELELRFGAAQRARRAVESLKSGRVAQ